MSVYPKFSTLHMDVTILCVRNKQFAGVHLAPLAQYIRMPPYHGYPSRKSHYSISVTTIREYGVKPAKPKSRLRSRHEFLFSHDLPTKYAVGINSGDLDFGVFFKFRFEIFKSHGGHDERVWWW